MLATPTLAATARDLADWLSTHEQPHLPPIVATTIGSRLGEVTVAFQLRSAGYAPVLSDLADWAEHLDTTVTLEPQRSGIHASITTALRNGQAVTLWNYLDFPRIRAVDSEGVVLDDGPIEVTPTLLRRAATAADESDLTNDPHTHEREEPV